MISLEGTIKVEGTKSLKWVCPVGTSSSYKTFTTPIDGTVFSNGHPSVNDDYIKFWLYIDYLPDLDNLEVTLDVGDGTFATDYYSYKIFSPGTYSGILDMGQGQSVSITSDQSANIPIQTTAPLSGTPSPETLVPTLSSTGSPKQTQVITQVSPTPSGVKPILSNQTLTYGNTSQLMQWSSKVWKEVKIPKSAFIQTGDQDWSAIAGIKFVFNSTALTGSGTAFTAYIDQMELVGGSDLEGDYWWMYTWGRTDKQGNIIHESSPSRTIDQFNIIGPITFDRHPFVYSNRPLSADPQVDSAVFYGIGGTLVDFWDVVEVMDNTTTGATIWDVGDSYANRKLVSKESFPAPSGTDMVLYQSKIWMVGDPNYPNLLRSSDILADGTFSPEGWPTRNAYDLSENHGALLNIDIVNKQMITRGHFGEWVIRVLDATDYTQVQSLRTTDKGCIGQYSPVVFEGSAVYPSSGGFVESNGNSANFVMPEIQPLATSSLGSAIGVNDGLISYFTYSTPTYGDRTAIIDMFRGKPRFSNANNMLFDWLYKDRVTESVYGVYNGSVYLLGIGYDNEAVPGKELEVLLVSRTFRPGGVCCWQRMEITHNTGGAWWRLEVYVDGRFVCSMPFKSNTRIRDYFQFGPASGHDFQFMIKGNYTTFGEILLPIRISHGGK